MGCYLSALTVKDGKLFDRISRRWVDHEEAPTLPEEIVRQLKQPNPSEKKEGKNATM